MYVRMCRRTRIMYVWYDNNNNNNNNHNNNLKARASTTIFDYVEIL
jgi:hypothetical protein